MKKRLIVLFLILVFLPMGLALWLGLSAYEDSRDASINRYHGFLTGRLSDIKNIVDSQVRDWENDFLALSSQLDLQKDQLRLAIRENPLMRQIFILGVNGELLFPTEEDISNQEIAFMERTASLWDRGLAYSLNEEARRVSYGWRKWFWQEGDQYFFWSKKQNGLLLGIDLDRYGLLADLIGILPVEPWSKEERQDHSIVLQDMQQSPFFQWGGNPYGENGPEVQLALDGPFSGWELHYYLNPELLPQDDQLGLLALIFGGVALAAIIAFAGYYFLKQVNHGIEEAGQRINFVNQVSHELKTPLTNIRLYSELLENKIDEANTKGKKYLDVIQNETLRLSRLIHNVLTFGSRKTSQPIHASRGDLGEQIAKILQSFRPSLDKLEFTVDWEDPGDLQGSYDGDLVEQVLGNLISNVEKYAREGKYLGIKAQRSGEMFYVYVEDQGPGIPQKDHNRVFRAFERLHNRITDAAGGTGIGMTISRDLARRHGGDLSIRERSNGACFEFSFKDTGE